MLLPLPGPMPKERPVPEPNRNRQVCAQPHAVRLRKKRNVSLTEEDTLWLRACGVAWEQKLAVQLPLDFSGPQKTMQKT